MALAVHYIALTVIGVSIVGSASVIVSTVYRAKYKTIGERFPLYLSTIDLLWSCSHSVDHVFFIMNGGHAVGCHRVATVFGLFRGFSLANLH
ncbi:hypothetical protein HDU67_006005 [Dinochytrium kinnereticum]|nr:hypothetical protein HDU67_006005 [Dinochytrium kinnereticum]